MSSKPVFVLHITAESLNQHQAPVKSLLSDNQSVLKPAPMNSDFLLQSYPFGHASQRQASTEPKASSPKISLRRANAVTGLRRSGISSPRISDGIRSETCGTGGRREEIRRPDRPSPNERNGARITNRNSETDPTGLRFASNGRNSSKQSSKAGFGL